MPLLPLSLALFLLNPQAPVSLNRKFVSGEKLAYKIESHITAEQRQHGLQTWIPSDFDINYNFNFVVKALKNDGVAVARYQRPVMEEIEGEEYNSVPKKKIEKSDKIYELLVSPVNEMLEMKDITPKKPTKKPVKKGSGRWAVAGAPSPQAPIFGEFIGEMHRLALFIGGIDSGLDFAPKLPLEAVKVGDTWKRTVGYQPQKLKGKDGKSAVQRLDYTYTYKGPRNYEGKQVLWVQATLVFDTDLVDFLKSLVGDDVRTNIKTMPMNMKATIDFNLDPKTRHTLSAAASSEGGFGLFLTTLDDAYVEEKFKGRTFLTLQGRKVGVK